jgi:hypothetical protein
MALATANLSCQPFVDPATRKLVWYCDAAVGPGGAGAKCSRAADCKTGVCGPGGVCIFGCHSDLECGSLTLKCNSVSVTVEGVSDSAKSCS